MNCSVCVNTTRIIIPKIIFEIPFLRLFSTFNRLNESQLVMLDIESKLTSVFCHMGDFGCGDGGWTPVMKIDGNKVRQN